CFYFFQASFFASSFRCPEAIFLPLLFPHLSTFSPCTYSETFCCSGSFSGRCQDTSLNNLRTFTATRGLRELLQAPGIRASERSPLPQAVESGARARDRKSTRLNSSHLVISY